MAVFETEELKNRLELSEYKRVLLQKQVSKGGTEEDSTLWSFVDLMTLLLILFILFYSHAVSQKGSAPDMANTQPQNDAAQAIEIPEIPTAAEPVDDDPHSPLEDETETEQETPDENLVQLERQVRQAVSEKIEKDFSIRWNQKRLVLVLGERIVFNVGEADLLPDFQPTLKRIAGFISSQDGYNVTVAGHTDDRPINTARFPSNWELSAIRAVNVAKFMILHGVNPHRISTEGYSAYRPVQPNTTAHNRHINRRVEITLIKDDENNNSNEKKSIPY